MIPYVLEQATNDRNNIVHYGHFEKHKMIITFITKISDLIYDFCNEYTGCNIKIYSYEDFCNKYTGYTDNKNVFYIKYFFNTWIDWEMDQDDKDEIYFSYVKQCLAIKIFKKITEIQVKKERLNEINTTTNGQNGEEQQTLQSAIFLLEIIVNELRFEYNEISNNPFSITEHGY